MNNQLFLKKGMKSLDNPGDFIPFLLAKSQFNLFPCRSDEFYGVRSSDTYPVLRYGSSEWRIACGEAELAEGEEFEVEGSGETEGE